MIHQVAKDCLFTSMQSTNTADTGKDIYTIQVFVITKNIQFVRS